jgi:transglutaminase-like putative cysteine protease
VTSPLTVTIQTSGTLGNLLLSPGVPLAVDADATVRLIGDHGWFAGADLPSGTTTYTVHARVPPLDGEAGTSANQLRAAGRDYPSSVIDRYTAVPPGVMGPSSQQLLRAILATAPERDPYDLAAAIEAYLRSDRFTYSVDPPAATCSSPSIVECFARSRTGYCLHFATTMAVLLRAALPDDPIPTRVVEGFLPGDRIGMVETVRTRSAHAWLEVYFPNYGWVPFDPTPSGPTRSVTAP